MLFNEKVLDLALSQIGLNIGWQSMSQQSMRILQTLVIKYIREIGKATMGFANNGNRHEALLSDVILAMRQMNVSLEEIQEYISEVDSVPFIKGNCIPLYPCPPPKGYVRINFPGVDEIATRPEYMEPWLPSLNFGDKSDEKDSANGTSGETNGQDGPTERETCPGGEGNMNDPKNGVAHEKLNDHIYLSSVYIDAEGRVVGIGGREGVAPDSRLPPKDDYEEKRIAEEEEKKRKSLEAEEQERKKKQKVEEVNKPIKTKIKEKPLTKLKKTDVGLKKKGALGVKGNTKKKFIVKVSLSGLHSGTPTAKPSPSLTSRSPTDFLDDDDDDDDEFDSLYINSKENSKIDEDTSANYENTINEVIERSRLEHDLEPEEIPDDDFDFKDSNLDVKNPKLKKIKKKILKKGKKKDSFDLTIDNVIKTSLGSEIASDEDKNVKDNVYTFSEENNLDVKLKEDTGVDAKEAAKILVSLSEDVPKKQKKADLKKSLKVSSPPPPVMSTFVGTKGSNASFPKVAPGSTPMSPNSNPTMFNNPFSSPLRSPPQPPIPTPPLFSDFYQLGTPMSFQSSSSKSTPLPKPALKTLAEKKALPPIDENLLLKKEKKEKKVKEKAADKKKNKEKEREKEREKKREKEREREREKEREREREREKEREREREKEKEEKAREKEREREREREREKEKEKEKEREKEREREREKVKEREREKEREKEKSKAKEKSKNIDKDDIKHEVKESKKLKKLKKSNNDDNWLDKKSDNNISSKLSIKAFTRHDESPVASPASSSSSNRLVIRSPPLSETIDQKDKKESKKKKQKAITSPSIDEPPTKKIKQIVKEKGKDKVKVKDDKKSKDKLKDDASCVLITETITKEERGQQGDKVWYCPVCSDPYDGHGNMIGCDGCDDWYHWICVGITEDPGEEESWFCVRCIQKQKAIETKVLKKTKKSDKPKQSKASKSSKTSKVGSSSSSSSWSCAVCNKSSNSKPCICCDSCDGWFHWPCVGIVVPPNDEDSWYCSDCIKTQ